MEQRRTGFDYGQRNGSGKTVLLFTRTSTVASLQLFGVGIFRVAKRFAESLGKETPGEFR
jgi:hypothetical protein